MNKEIINEIERIRKETGKCKLSEADILLICIIKQCSIDMIPRPSNTWLAEELGVSKATIGRRVEKYGYSTLDCIKSSKKNTDYYERVAYYKEYYTSFAEEYAYTLKNDYSRSEYQRKYYKKNKQRLQEQHSKQYRKRMEAIKSDPEKYREYLEKNREQVGKSLEIVRQDPKSTENI